MNGSFTRPEGIYDLEITRLAAAGEQCSVHDNLAIAATDTQQFSSLPTPVPAFISRVKNRRKAVSYGCMGILRSSP
jgi:hypothetical protein